LRRRRISPRLAPCSPYLAATRDALLGEPCCWCAGAGWGEYLALGAGVTGDCADAVGLIALLSLTNKVRSPDTPVLFFATGGGGVALGALAIGVQAAVGCSDVDSCRAAYGTGAAAMAVGALWIGLGFYSAATTPRGRPYAGYVPVPLVIRTERGAVPGLGIAGVGF
jgi:hypothetical protein